MIPLTLPDFFSADECARITAAADAADAADARLVRGDTAHHIRRADLVRIDDLPDMA